MPRNTTANLVAATIAKRVEARIRAYEGAYTQIVLNDFREGLQANSGNDRIAYAQRWDAMYRRVTR